MPRKPAKADKKLHPSPVLQREMLALGMASHPCSYKLIYTGPCRGLVSRLLGEAAI